MYVDFKLETRVIRKIMYYTIDIYLRRYETENILKNKSGAIPREN